MFIPLQETPLPDQNAEIPHTLEPKQNKKESFCKRYFDMFGGFSGYFLNFCGTFGVQESFAEKTAEPMQISAQDAVDSHLECVRYMSIYVKLGETILIYI